MICDSALELWSIKSGCIISNLKACISPNLGLRVVKTYIGNTRTEIFFYNKIE